MSPLLGRRFGSSRRATVVLAAALVALAACTGADPDVAVESVDRSPIDSAGGGADDPPFVEQDDDTTASDPTDASDGTEQPDGDDDAPDQNPAGVPTPPSDLEFFTCGTAECSTVTVPIDPDQPDLGMLDIAVNVVRTADPESRRGYLLVNPGGPGASGVQFAAIAAQIFPRELLDAFDVVGFDPRGVGLSDPELGCGGIEAHQARLDLIDGQPDTEAEVNAMETAVQNCIDETGPAAAYLGTEFVAHDMEAIRLALGADTVSYYGASYGSDVGVWFATLYPDSVRAMVVDGADNPVDAVATAEERIDTQLDQIRAFDELLQAALASCDSDACPIFNDGDPTAYYLEAMEQIALVDEARPTLRDAGFFGVLSTLYAESQWTVLHQGLFELNENSDPAILARSSDLQASASDVREPEWIGCLDNWSLFPALDRETQLEDSIAIDAAFREEFPLLAAASSVDDNTGLCPFLDVHVPTPLDGPLDGADVPILVVGNPSDPATPFTESVELVEDTLTNGYLLEADNPEHVVFARGNQCVDDLVNQVLIEIDFPGDRRVVCARR